MIESQEQKYMKIAHAFTEDAKEVLSDKEQDDYHSRVQSAPVLIHDTGLMQTLAFYLSKGNKSDYSLLAKHLLSWLNCGRGWANHDSGSESETDQNWILFSRLTDQSQEELMINTEKTLKLLQWLKRFAEARLKKEN